MIADTYAGTLPRLRGIKGQLCIATVRFNALLTFLSGFAQVSAQQ